MTDTDIPTATGPLPVYLSMPTTTAPWPAVIVIHDALGMSNDLRRQADWLAGSGYLAAAPDLYRGGHKLRCMFAAIRDARAGRGRTFDDIDIVRTWLTDRADCAGPVGIIGYCMGVGFVLMLAPTHRYTAASVTCGTAGKDVLSLDY